MPVPMASMKSGILMLPAPMIAFTVAAACPNDWAPLIPDRHAPAMALVVSSRFAPPTAARFDGLPSAPSWPRRCPGRRSSGGTERRPARCGPCCVFVPSLSTDLVSCLHGLLAGPGLGVDSSPCALERGGHLDRLDADRPAAAAMAAPATAMPLPSLLIRDSAVAADRPARSNAGLALSTPINSYKIRCTVANSVRQFAAQTAACLRQDPQHHGGLLAITGDFPGQRCRSAGRADRLGAHQPIGQPGGPGDRQFPGWPQGPAHRQPSVSQSRSD